MGGRILNTYRRRYTIPGDPMAIKEPTSFTLTGEARALLRLLSAKWGSNNSAMIERLIREQAQRDDITSSMAGIRAATNAAGEVPIIDTIGDL